MCLLLDLSESSSCCMMTGVVWPIVSSVHLPSEVPVFYLLLGRGFLFILDINPLILDVASIFLALLLTLSMVSTVENKSYILV